jgi:hypothetical protein
MKFFEARFLEEAAKFIAELDSKTIKKIFYNIDLAEQTNDPKLLKKLQNDIWEFRKNTRDFKSDFLHFGTRQIVKKLWCLQPTAS